MSGRGRSRKRQSSQATGAKRRRVSPSPERVVLPSVEGNRPANAQGNANRPPLVEEVFDISAILKDRNVVPFPSDSPQSPATDKNASTPFLSMDFGDEPVTMVRCADDDLAVHVPQQLKQKIWDNKYINISLLLKGNAELAEIYSGGLLHVVDGKIEARPKQSKEKVNSIEQWTEAFLIFMSIYVAHYPDKIQELLNYIMIIRDAAAKFPTYSWRQYDEQFRVRQAVKVESWGKVNPDLWLRIMPVSTGFSTAQSVGTAYGSCREFNSKGNCNFFRCRYKHICDLCGSAFHGMIRCQVGKEAPAGRGFRGFRYGGFSRGNVRGFRGYRGRGFPYNRQ